MIKRYFKIIWGIKQGSVLNLRINVRSFNSCKCFWFQSVRWPKLAHNNSKSCNSSLIVLWETNLAGIISGCTRPVWQGREVQQWASLRSVFVCFIKNGHRPSIGFCLDHVFHNVSCLLEKLKEWCDQLHGCNPAISLRWWTNVTLKKLDPVVEPQI